MSLRVVHINTSVKGGAGIAALRLQQAQQGIGVQAAYLAKDLCIDFNGTKQENTYFRYKKPSLLSRILNKILPKKSLVMAKELAKIKPNLRCEMASLPFGQVDLLDHPLVKTADIIHLHWVVGLVDYPSFFKNNKKPIVWTLHDMNPFLGMFHYSQDHAQNKAVAGDLEHRVKNIKAKALLNLKMGAVVSPSSWLLASAKSAKVFIKNTSFTEIANAIDIKKYAPSPDSTQQHQELTLLYTAGNLENPRKGVDLVIDALNNYPAPITLLTVGKGQLTIKNPKVKIVPLGYIDNPQEMIASYWQADALLLPSREDNLPNTMVESLCCGTPVISFNTGGMQQYIQEGINGCLSATIDSEGLRQAIIRFQETQSQFIAQSIATSARTHFQGKNQAKKYLNLYLELQNKITPKN